MLSSQPVLNHCRGSGGGSIFHVRKSEMPLVTTHVVAGVDMEPHMPASLANTQRAPRFNSAWWVDHQDEMNERFSAWLVN